MNEPWMGNRAWLEERPAHQWRNGSDLSKRLASDAPKKSFRERGPCHLPLLARGEVSGFGSLGPRFQVMGTWAQHGVPPQRDGVGDGACPWMVRKPVEQGAKVRRLLEPARLDRRLAWTPPISMDSISSVDTHLTISFNAHCLETRVSSILEAAWLTICVSLLQTSSQKASGCPVPRDQSFFRITLRPCF